MTQLARTRRQVKALRRHRLLVRWATALAPLVTGVLLILALFWAVDFYFQLDATQRIAMQVVCGVALLWVFVRYTKPLLSRHETVVDVALMVEKTHGLDSDLVAALQFDASPSVHYGSTALKSAVVRQATELGKRIDFFEGASYDQFARRAFAAALVIMLAAASVVVFPGHVRVFFQRLLLGSDHYPTQTVIDTVVVNGNVVLNRAHHPTQPDDCAAAQGQPVSMLVRCLDAERLPSDAAISSGELRLIGKSGGNRIVPLEALSLADRQARLETVAARLQEAITDSSILVDEQWLDDLASTIAFDAPRARTHLREARHDRSALSTALFELRRVKGSWPGTAADFFVFQGQLDRLIETVEYKIYVGDARTDSARIEIISLPVITLDLQVVPPEYAASETARKRLASRQISVLEGSAITMSLRAANNKQLAAAWVRVRGKTGSSKWDLAPRPDQPQVWELVGDTSFSRITEQFSFEVIVRDVDGLQPESPIQGVVRLRADQPPTTNMELVHRVVLPTARPVIAWRTNDDFGISRLLLHLSIQRQHNTGSDSGSSADQTTANSVSADRMVQEIPLQSAWLPAEQLPYRDRYPVDLAALELAKGDQVKLTIEAFDYRGEGTPGKATLSEAVVLDISDEAGVLAAIAAADENSEARLTEVITEQLGIGDEQ